MALRFVKTQNFENVNLHRFERVASFLRLDSKWITREVTTVVKRALELWPSAVPELLGEERGKQIIDRLNTLKLVGEVRG
jgi:serine/threonine-protein kinase HipA